MPKTCDISGQKFGLLTAVKMAGVDKNQSRLWLWRCDCGSEIERVPYPIRIGRVISCGCYQRLFHRPNKKHGQWKSRTYRAWIGMKARVNGNDKNIEKYYVGKGIKICSRWLNDFSAFFEDMGECQPGMTLERNDFNGDYEPSNCRWATQYEQLRNTSRTVFVIANGQRMCLKDACNIVGIGYDCVRSRIRKGFDPQESLDMGPSKRQRIR